MKIELRKPKIATLPKAQLKQLVKTKNEEYQDISDRYSKAHNAYEQNLKTTTAALVTGGGLSGLALGASLGGTLLTCGLAIAGMAVGVLGLAVIGSLKKSPEAYEKLAPQVKKAEQEARELRDNYAERLLTEMDDPTLRRTTENEYWYTSAFVSGVSSAESQMGTLSRLETLADDRKRDDWLGQLARASTDIELYGYMKDELSNAANPSHSTSFFIEELKKDKDDPWQAYETLGHENLT